MKFEISNQITYVVFFIMEKKMRKAWQPNKNNVLHLIYTVNVNALK